MFLRILATFAPPKAKKKNVNVLKFVGGAVGGWVGEAPLPDLKNPCSQHPPKGREARLQPVQIWLEILVDLTTVRRVCTAPTGFFLFPVGDTPNPPRG